MPRSILPWLCALALTTGCAPGGALEPCRVEGVKEKLLCGSVRVPEDRQMEGGRLLDLKVVVLPARDGERAAPPLFFLEGGPGVAATPRAAQLANSPLRLGRDLVLVDARGTGGSNPLRCEIDGFGELLPSLYTLDTETLEECREGFDADLRHYTTADLARDVDEVRRALGAERIDLWGASYGTRLAFEVLRRYPERVRAVALQGVAPPFQLVPLDLPRDSQAALEATLAACEEEPRCRGAYPELKRRLDTVLERLAASPAPVTVRHPDTGEEAKVLLTRDLFAGVLRFLLYDARTAARIPATVTAAESGDFAPLADFAVRFASTMEPRFHLGATLAVLCSEDASRFTEEEVVAAAEGTFLGASLGRNLLEVCTDWPRGEVAEDFHQPVRSEVPVLMISGALDPITPPRWAEQALPHLPNAAHLVLPEASHSSGDARCVERVLARFFDAGTAEGLDAGCLEDLRRPPFRRPE